MRPEPPDRTALRLRSAAGHLRGVGTLFESGTDHRIVLAQLAAVQAALAAVRRALIAGLVDDCSKAIRESNCPETRESELLRMVDGLQRSLGRPGRKGDLFR